MAGFIPGRTARRAPGLDLADPCRLALQELRQGAAYKLTGWNVVMLGAAVQSSTQVSG